MKLSHMPSGPEVSVHYARKVGRYSQIVRIGADTSVLPPYTAGQHCRLFRQLDRSEKYFSIASSPSETAHHGYIELYVAGEISGSTGGGEKVDFYFDDRIGDQRYILTSVGGGFTLAQKAAGYDHIVMISTGTGIAPFRSMIREMIDAGQTGRGAVTLLHSHHTVEEFPYHEECAAFQRSFDFLYLPSVTTPRGNEPSDMIFSSGRVTTLLRMILGMPLSSSAGKTESHLSPSVDRGIVSERLRRPRTIIMACGNPSMLGEIRDMAAECNLPCVGEGWELNQK